MSNNTKSSSVTSSLSSATSSYEDSGKSSGVELEISSERLIEGDDVFEEDYDIVEVDRTPIYPDEGNFARIKKVASIMSGNISLVNTTVGAGILSLPIAMHKFGIIIGIILILIMGFLGYCAMFFLAEAADALYKEEQKKNNGKYPDININFTWVGVKLAPKLAPVLDLILFLLSSGILIAYLIVVGDAFPVICKSYLDDDESGSASSSEEKEWYVKMVLERWFWIIVVCIIVWPLSYAKKLDALRYFSALMLPCVTYIIVLLIVRAAEKSSSVKFYPRNTTAFSALSILLFAFSCHINYYSVYQELGPKNRRKRAAISGASSVVVVCAFYILAGLFGYIYAGEDTKGNVINNLPGKSASSTIARIAIAINVLVAYPCLLSPARNGLTGLLQLSPKIRAMNKNVIHVITTTFICLVSLLSIPIESIDVVLSFCGCIGSSLTSFIFPGYYYYLVYKDDPTRKTMVRLAVAFSILGFIFMIVGFVLQILDLV